MKTTYLKVLGMTCDHCRHRIEGAVKNLQGVREVNVILEENKVILTYDETITEIEDVIGIITELGYNTNEGMAYESEDEFRFSLRNKVFSIAFIFIGIIFLYLFLKDTFGFDFLNIIPNIDNSVSLPLLFVIGLMTSIHCVGMCGAINLAASTGIKIKHPFRRPFLYNAGRVISYTITGGLAGLIGKVLTPNTFFQGILVGFAAVFMLLMGLSMLGIISKKVLAFLPKSSRLARIRTSSPFLLGLLNGLMPCGPLQAMQIYAISTASFVLGALSLFLFALGTVPLMLLVGLIFNSVKGKKIYVLQRISAVLVIVLSFVMFTRSMGYLGINFQFGGTGGYETAEIREDYQYVRIDVRSGSYQRIKVQAGIPVKFDMYVGQGKLNGCNNTVIIPSMDIRQTLSLGDNIIEFTPEKTGTINYSCWMSMIRSQIIVVDDLSSPSQTSGN